MKTLRMKNSPSTSNVLVILRLVCLTAAISSAVAFSACNKKTNTGSSADTETTSPTASTTASTTTAAAEETTAPLETTGTIPDGVPQLGWCTSEDGLHVRKTPDTDYEAIGGLRYGEKVSIVGREGDWYKINFKDGHAYVSAAYISPTEIIVPETTTPAPATTTTAAQ